MTPKQQGELYRLVLETRISLNTVRKWMRGERVQPANRQALEAARERLSHDA
jgi:hypothetical protein